MLHKPQVTDLFSCEQNYSHFLRRTTLGKKRVGWAGVRLACSKATAVSFTKSFRDGSQGAGRSAPVPTVRRRKEPCTKTRAELEAAVRLKHPCYLAVHLVKKSWKFPVYLALCTSLGLLACLYSEHLGAQSTCSLQLLKLNLIRDCFG